MKTYNSYIGNLGIAIFQCFTLLWVFPKDYCIKADCTHNVIFAKILRFVKSYKSIWSVFLLEDRNTILIWVLQIAILFHSS